MTAFLFGILKLKTISGRTTVIQIWIFWPTEAVAMVEQPTLFLVAVTIMLG